MKSIRLLIIFLWVGVTLSTFAQHNRLDSLLTINNGYHKQDSLKVMYLKDVFRAYASLQNYSQSKHYADSALVIASSLTNKSILAHIYQRIGVVYHITDRFQAIIHYRKSIEIAQKCGALKTEAGSYLNLGSLYMSIPDFSSSLDVHERALALYLSIGNQEGMTSCYMNIATIYNGLNQRVKSIEYARKALALFEVAKSERGIAVACDILGSTYLLTTNDELIELGNAPNSKFDLATELFNNGLHAASSINDHGMIATIYGDFGRLNGMLGKKELALQYFLRAIEMSKPDVANREIYLDNLVNAGIFYCNQMNEPEKGSEILFYALQVSQQISRIGPQMDIYFAFSDMHANKKRFDSALFYYRKGIIIKDSISSQEKEKEITRKQLKLDFTIKEREYKETQLLSDVKLRQQVLIASQQEQELLLKRQQLEISNKEKILQRLKFLQKQLEFENAQKLQTAKLTQKELEKKLETHNRDEKINDQQQQIQFTNRLTLIMGILLLILSSAAFVVFKAKQRMSKLNQLVSAQKDELLELGKVKDKIFSIVSHDMRAPVNNLVAFSALLEEGEIKQDKLAKYIEQIKGTLDYTSSMMENLLNWSASQMHGFSPVNEKIGISSLVQHVIEGISSSAGKKNITLINKINSEVYVFGDKNMVELILRNLLSNAVKFSKKDTSIELYHSFDSGKNISLSIQDEGVGLTAANVKLINANSVRSLESTFGTDKEKGTGLGLMLCKHFAFMMQGNISVQSTEGKGSVFTLTLPAV